MRILFLGDLVGRSGRNAIIERLGKLRDSWALDFVVLNAENATDGSGLSTEHAKKLLDAGADCLTLGDHAFDQRDLKQFIDQEPRIVRPLNFAKAPPGRGARVFRDMRGRKVLVTQVLGQTFMKRPFSDPFAAIDEVLKAYPLGGQIAASIVDFHCEATSEKVAMGFWCDGRATAVIGTHTHIPTADARILPNGTAYQTDAGMCGDYDSIIGIDKKEPMRRFTTGMSDGRFKPAKGAVTLSGMFLETDDRTGKAKRVTAVRDGGALPSVAP